jgi:hypothetical protein
LMSSSQVLGSSFFGVAGPSIGDAGSMATVFCLGGIIEVKGFEIS